MLTHRGFSAWIVVNGQPVPEYLAAVDPVANRVSCWIPSEEGQVSFRHRGLRWEETQGAADCHLTEFRGLLARSWREGGHMFIYQPGRFRRPWKILVWRWCNVEGGSPSVCEF